ncbi:MAG: membrane protein insertase YidC [Bacteroidales bacterium]|nr:membrane protein insertase YidC [Candidatus Physcousia equi]
MDKNTITGFVLIGTVLVGFSYFSRPSKEEIEAQERYNQELREAAVRDSIRQATQDSINAIQDDSTRLALRTDSTKAFFNHRDGEEKEIVLKNNKVAVTLNTHGGTLTNATLLGDYKARDKKSPVTLLSAERTKMQLILEGRKELINSEDYYFDAVNQTDSTVTMRLTAANGGTLDFNYKLRPNSFMTDFTVQACNLGEELSLGGNKMKIIWEDYCQQQEKGRSFESRYATLTYKEKDDDSDYVTAMGQNTENIEETLDWVAFKNQFFSCVLIGHDDFTNASLTSNSYDAGDTLKYYCADLQTSFDPTGKKATTMQLYLGPNDYHLLKEHNKMSLSSKDIDLEELVYLGWPLFKWINRFFILYIFDWLSGWGLSMGLVLLLLTILIKVIVYPTTRKSFLSSARMRVLRPKIDALSQKYPKKEDAMKKQQEMMGIYREYGVSPMGGCLPMLIQMPIWIALFNFVPNAIQLRGESFLWADDLSAYDELINWGTDLPLIGDHLSIFCLLFCITNIVNTWISMRQQRDQMSTEQAGQMKVMRYMMYGMPIMFFFMFNTYSSGLCYYYFLSGLTSILIMWYLRKTTDDKKLLAQLEAYREQHKSDPKKLSGMAARLEAMQKQQEQLRQLKEQQKRK